MAAVRAGQANVSAGTDSVSSLMSAFRGAGESAGSFSDAAGFGAGSGGSGGGAGTSTPLAQAAGFGGSGADSSKGSAQSQAKSAQDGGSNASAGTSKAQQSSAGASSGDSTGGFLVSAAKAGKVAVEAGSILAQHSASRIGDAVQERIRHTAGGKLAAAIRASSQTDQATEDVPTFGGNSLAAADSVDEVAAFANRDNGKEV